MSVFDKNALTEKQEEFCQAYLVTGDAQAAYTAAYNSFSIASASVNAAKLLRNPKIRSRLRELSDNRIQTFVPTALKTMTDIASNPTHKDASSNAKHILALAGYQPHQVIEVHKIDTATKIKAITAMVATLHGLGMQIDINQFVPAGLLGKPKVIDDDEFVAPEL